MWGSRHRSIKASCSQTRRRMCDIFVSVSAHPPLSHSREPELDCKLPLYFCLNYNLLFLYRYWFCTGICVLCSKSQYCVCLKWKKNNRTVFYTVLCMGRCIDNGTPVLNLCSYPLSCLTFCFLQCWNQFFITVSILPLCLNAEGVLRPSSSSWTGNSRMFSSQSQFKVWNSSQSLNQTELARLTSWCV